jgi:hypothetical protein
MPFRQAQGPKLADGQPTQHFVATMETHAHLNFKCWVADLALVRLEKHVIFKEKKP